MGPLIKAKAYKLAKEMDENFAATKGWFYRFNIKRGLSFKSISGEAALVTPEMLKEWKEEYFLTS